MDIRRIFVEKKPGCDLEAQGMLKDIKENLGIKALSGIRLLNRYDVAGIAPEHFDRCAQTIFSEPPVDFCYQEQFPLNQGERAFVVKYQPGQYDQRADSAEQCVQIVTQSDGAQVSVAKVVVAKGDLTEQDIKKIKAYCINPVDSMEASAEKPTTLQRETGTPADIKRIEGFINFSEQELQELRASMGFAMSLEDLLFCRDYFKNTEGRSPSVTELRVLDTYWSDHCRHTTFLTAITDVEFSEGRYIPAIRRAYDLYLQERAAVYGEREKDICLMDIAVMGMKALKKKGLLDNLDESEEINACSIEVLVDVNGVQEPWLVMFKNETHNHPTEIEPFGGAATCLGGAIRDPLSGRAYVYQAMRVTGSGDPRVPVEETLPGKLPQRKITTIAAHGYSSYGNQIGLATGHVSEVYHPGYIAKRMEVGAVIGAVKKENVVRDRPAPGDVVLLVGGRTGRDGCGGATGSSKGHTEESTLTSGAEVQKGNPPTERKLQRLFRNPAVTKLIKRCNDFGAGGVSVAIGELADGLVIDLDAVPKKYDGLDGTELAISESQERMAVVVAPEDAEKFIEYALEENLEATLVARVTEEKRLVMSWRGDKIVDISREFLDTNGMRQSATVKITDPLEPIPDSGKSGEPGLWLKNLQSLNVACQKGLVEGFDSTIGVGTALMPFGGKYALTPAEVMAAKIPVLDGDTKTVTVMAHGFNPEISERSPFHGAAMAVVESAAKVVAAGGDYKTIRLSLQEYFEKMGKDNWHKPFTALLGAFYAQMKTGMAAIGGKDSMSGTFNDISVPPTLVSFAVGISNTDDIISPEFKNIGSKIVLLNTKYTEDGLPDFHMLKSNFDFVREGIQKGTILSAHTVGFGGVGAAITKMCAGNMIGVRINCDELYSPRYGSFILEMTPESEAPESAQQLGITLEAPEISVNGEIITLEKAIQAWTEPLEDIFPFRQPENQGQAAPQLPMFSLAAEERTNPTVKIAEPRILIPVFPGTNCEYDTSKAFAKAGGKPKTLVAKNLTVNLLEQYIKELVKEIKSSQIIALPGGFSAGDEPDGSGKFIAAVFSNKYVAEAVEEFLEKRDGLMIGICNGFQALLKLGLLTHGKIRPMGEESPTLTYNKIGRHISVLAHTKVVSNKSPWLWSAELGAVYTIPFSHGEGRFIGAAEQIKKLAENGQISTRYVDLKGEPSMDVLYNPNGSDFAVESLCSPDGRVFGKMGHSERIGNGLYKNVPGNKDQKIFEAGVRYFS